jgi:CRISPR-associated endonuclease/helicase Cas3
MDVSQTWGKLDRARSRSHHLAHDCADVAACFLGLATSRVLRGRLEKAAGRALSATDVERLGVLVFLHDAGKLHPGFQAKGWPDGIWSGPRTGHIQEGLDIFIALGDRPAAQALHLDHLCAWGVDESLLRTVLAHHGRPLKRHNGDRAGPARH